MLARMGSKTLIYCNVAHATVEDSLTVSYKTNTLLPNNPATAVLGVAPDELKAAHTKTCTQVFAAALFIIVQT